MIIIGVTMIERMRDLIDAVLEGKRYKEYYDILHDSVLAIDAKVIIDLGTFMGLSAEAFAKAADKTGGKVYTVDIAAADDPIRKEAYNLSRERLGMRDNVELIQGDSIAVGEQWDKGDVDLVFCDSDHSYERVAGELMIWGGYNPKVFFIHDTVKSEGSYGYPFCAMRDYAEKMNKPFFNFDLRVFNPGLGVIVMEGR